MLTAEGSEVVKHGSHEARVYNAVDGTTGTPQAQIMVCECSPAALSMSLASFSLTFSRGKGYQVDRSFSIEVKSLLFSMPVNVSIGVLMHAGQRS